jgi:hypothetical protein
MTGQNRTLRKPARAGRTVEALLTRAGMSRGFPAETVPARSPPVAHLWYYCGMARVRVSTTVDEELLTNARRARSELADSALIDEALAALLARNRAVEIDAAYAAYDSDPLEAGDEWGDLASFRKAAGAS